MKTTDDKKPENSLMRLADRPEDYQRYGILPHDIKQFEDGMRSDARKGAYEWWYFDSNLDDGSKLVVVFYTKPMTEASEPNFVPQVSIELDLKDGRSFTKRFDVPLDAFRAAQDRCDVWMGNNHFTGDLNKYKITASIDDVSVDIDLTGEVPAWRPKSGLTLFKDKEKEHLSGWLPSVPQGLVKVCYRIGSEEHNTTGVGYHDHNWGDISMVELIHDWYWGRAKIGPYTVVASYITALKKYGYEHERLFLLAKGREIIAEDERKVTFSTDQVHKDKKTGKPVADITRYEYKDGAERYVVTFTREKTIVSDFLAEHLPWLKRTMAKLAGFDGAYLRFTGKVALEHFVDDRSVERIKDDALWELMYFGHAQPLAVTGNPAQLSARSVAVGLVAAASGVGIYSHCRNAQKSKESELSTNHPRRGDVR